MINAQIRQKNHLEIQTFLNFPPCQSMHCNVSLTKDWLVKTDELSLSFVFLCIVSVKPQRMWECSNTTKVQLESHLEVQPFWDFPLVNLGIPLSVNVAWQKIEWLKLMSLIYYVLFCIIVSYHVLCIRFEAARSNPEAVNIDEFLSLEVGNITFKEFKRTGSCKDH